MAATVLMVARLGAAEPGRGDLAGAVRLLLADGRQAAATQAVVWIAGGASAAARSSAQPAAVASKGKRFEPHVLVVTRGSTVSFPNVDAIFHNAFSRTPGSEFDLGLYRHGAARAFTFRTPGLVHVYCNIHAEMASYVMVLAPDDAFALTDTAGAFRLAGLPAGPQTLHVWSETGGEKEVTVEVGAAAAPLEVDLDASTWRPAAHKNKYGRDYPPATQGVDRY